MEFDLSENSVAPSTHAQKEEDENFTFLVCGESGLLWCVVTGHILWALPAATSKPKKFLLYIIFSASKIFSLWGKCFVPTPLYSGITSCTSLFLIRIAPQQQRAIIHLLSALSAKSTF